MLGAEAEDLNIKIKATCIITEKMKVPNQSPTFDNYSITNWTPYLARLVYIISAFYSLLEGAAVCPLGRMPPDCQSECKLGYYGNDCALPCATTCVDRACQPDNGFCYRCQIGFTGLSCSRTCHRGFFGQDCNNTCPTSCYRKHCDPFTGFCEKCVPGYEGVRCEIHYSLRNHTNQTSSSLSHGDTLGGIKQTNKYVNTIVYISSAVIICIMSLCSTALWVYLLKLKAGQKYLKTPPIYRKHGLNVLSSSFLRRTGATAAHEYVEMEPVDADYDTTAEADTEPNIDVNVFPDKNAADIAKCAGSATINQIKHILSLPKMKVAGRRVDTVLAKDAEEVRLNHDGIDTPELSNILKINAPLRVEQAANYSRDLYFKSHLSSQQFPPSTDHSRHSEREQQELSMALPPGDRLGPLSLVREKKTKADTIDMEVIDVSRKQTTNSSTDRWYRPRSKSQPLFIGESNLMPNDASQKPPVIVNLARKLSQNGKHYTQPAQLPKVNCLRGEEGSRTGRIPQDCGQAVFNTDIPTQSEKNDERGAVPALTGGHRSKVYAETTEPLLRSGRLLWRLRKSLASFIHRALQSSSQTIYERVSEDRRRAVESAEYTKSELAIIQPELGRQEVPRQSECLCNCLDCESQTDANKFDLEFTCRGFQAQTEEHYKDVVVLAVAACADNYPDDTQYQQEVGCSADHSSDDDSSGLNEYIIGVISRSVGYKQTFSGSQGQARSDVVNERNYTISPREYVKQLASEPLDDIHNGIKRTAGGKNSCVVSQDYGITTPPVTNLNNLSIKRSLINDATNNFSFFRAKKKPYQGDKKMIDQAEHNDIPEVTASSSKPMDLLPSECKGQHHHNPHTERYNQQRIRESAEVGKMYTARSNRRPPPYTPSNPEKYRMLHFVETPFKNSSPNSNAEEKTVDLDVLSAEAFPGAGAILLQTKAKQTNLNNTHLDNVGENDIPDKSDSFVYKTKLDTSVVRSHDKEDATATLQKNQESEYVVKNKCQPPLQSANNVDENAHGTNIGSDLGEHTSLIPKSVITLTVSKQPNREIKSAYTGDLAL